MKFKTYKKCSCGVIMQRSKHAGEQVIYSCYKCRTMVMQLKLVPIYIDYMTILIK